MGLGPVASLQPDPLCWAGREGRGPHPGLGSCLLPPQDRSHCPPHPWDFLDWGLSEGKAGAMRQGVGVCGIFGLDLGRHVYHLEQDGLRFKTVFFKVQLMDQPKLIHPALA